MIADVITTTNGGCRPVTPGPSRSARPPERAELVWRRALRHADATSDDQFAVALELLRAAQHSPATMMHALSLGRTHVRMHPEDRSGLGGVAILEAANAFLGIKPWADDVVTGRP